MKQKLKNGDEYDVVYGRRWYNFKAGTIKLIKRAMNKRFRRKGKEEVREEMQRR